MRIRLADIKPNSQRDFRLDPVDPENVEKLGKSIHEFGFWPGVIARQTPSGVEAVAGWHRILAAISQGITHADIHVGTYTDDQALRMYAAENSTQRGNTSSAVLGSIGAAIRILLRESLTTGASTSGRRTFSQGRDGIGRPAILAKLHGVHGITDTVVKQQTAILKASGEYDRIVSEVIAQAEAEQAARQAAAARAEEEARERAEAQERRRVAAEERRRVAAEERARAEEERRLATEARAAARAEKERRLAAEREAAAQRAAEAAARREETARREAEAQAAAAAETEAERAAAASVAARAEADGERLAARREQAAAEAETRPVEFDVAVATVFRDPRHVETFRVLVTTDRDLRRVMHERISLQLPLAQAILEKQRQMMAEHEASGGPDGRPGNRRHASHCELTSAFIQNHIFDLASAPIMLQHFADQAARREAAEALARAGWLKRWNLQEESIAGHTRSLANATTALALLLREDVPAGSGMRSQKIRHAILTLQGVLAKLESFGFHRQAETGESENITNQNLIGGGVVIDNDAHPIN